MTPPLLAHLPRASIEEAVAVLIAELDRRDGDIDLEPEIDVGADDLGESDAAWGNA